jgi:hypothetical protein
MFAQFRSLPGARGFSGAETSRVSGLWTNELTLALVGRIVRRNLYAHATSACFPFER